MNQRTIVVVWVAVMQLSPVDILQIFSREIAIIHICLETRTGWALFAGCCLCKIQFVWMSKTEFSDRECSCHDSIHFLNSVPTTFDWWRGLSTKILARNESREWVTLWWELICKSGNPPTLVTCDNWSWASRRREQRLIWSAWREPGSNSSKLPCARRAPVIQYRLPPKKKPLTERFWSSFLRSTKGEFFLMPCEQIVSPMTLLLLESTDGALLFFSSWKQTSSLFCSCYDPPRESFLEPPWTGSRSTCTDCIIIAAVQMNIFTTSTVCRCCDSVHYH